MPRKAKAKAKKRKRTDGIHISLQRNETVNNDIIVTNSNEPEIWDLKRQIRRKRECSCHTPGCTEQAIAIWVSNKTTTAGNEWLTCEECQITDFGGWPEGEVPVNNDNDNGSHTNDIMSLSRNNDTISSGKESSFTTPSPKQRQVPRVAVTPSPPLMKEKLQRNLATIRFCTMPQSIIEGKDRQDRQKQKWTDRQSLYSIPRRSIQPEEPCICKLRRGGTLKIYPNLVHHMETKRVKEDLFSCGLFRQYQIQGQNEPRLHFLLNDNATNDDFETSLQPGYSYANVKMKARPLKILPELEQLSQKLATVSGVDRWTIGVNPVLYRDCQDKMGSHADDDQGEQVILCLIVSSLQEARRVIITPNDKKSIPAHGDEIIELKLRPGDAYEMDGKMQRHYVHSVPREKKETKEQDNSSRIAIVFRTGNEVRYSRDSGRPCTDLSPRTPKFQVFGNQIPGLVEGDVYPRSELFQRCAHLMQQRGISGNEITGADAIIVSGRREDGLGTDQFLKLMYAVESAKGAKSVVTSSKKKLPIRVFRSSIYKSPYRALRPPSFHKACQTVYRYDGLYRVMAFQEPSAPKGPFKFELHRIDAGPDDMSNRIPNSEFVDNCCRLGTITDENKRAFTRRGKLLPSG